jgi:hypothetical protein
VNWLRNWWRRRQEQRKHDREFLEMLARSLNDPNTPHETRLLTIEILGRKLRK